MTKTQTHTDGTTAVFPTGTQVYDTLMSRIEQDLTTAHLPTLKEKYKDETPEESSARQKRYELAYFLYDQAFAHWANDLHQTVHEYRRESLKNTEAKARTGDLSVMTNIEEAFASTK